jgi:hypothetical protein
MMQSKVQREAEAEEKRVVEQMAEILPPEKERRGGRRRGAGRKPNYLKKVGLPPVTANVILGNFDVVRIWSTLLNSKDEDVRLRTICYLTNREQGCPQTSVEINPGEGEIIRLLQAGRDRLAKERAERKTNEPPPEPPASVIPPRLQLHCSRHGDYPKPYVSKPGGDMCPMCVAEAESAERKLRGMLPGGVN